MNTKHISLKGLVLVATILSSGFAFAAQSAKTTKNPVDEDAKNPLGCRNLGYQFKFKVLNLTPKHLDEDGVLDNDKQALYFVFNKLPRPVNLFQMRPNDSTHSTYLNHVVRSQQWAVLATGEDELKYICTVDDAKSSYGKVVDCGESLKVCEFARVKFGMNNRGNYWIVNSNSRGGAVSEVVHYGIIPR